MIDQRLASRLSTPAGQTRSSRKSRIHHLQLKGKIPSDSMSSSGQSGLDTLTTTESMSTSPHASWHESWTSFAGPDGTASIIGQDDIDTANRMNQMQTNKDVFDDMQQQVQDASEGTLSKPIPTLSDAFEQNASCNSMKRPAFGRARSDGANNIRRVMSEGPSSLLQRMSEVKTGSAITRTRKSTSMSSKSMRTRTKSPGNTKEKSTSDHSKRTNNLSESKSSQGANSAFRRNMSGNKSASRRSTRRRTVAASAATTKAATSLAPEGTWECKCGYVLKDRYTFCGMCGCKKYWTCEECDFAENMSQFAYCGNCGVPRETTDHESSSGSLDDPFVNLRPTPPKLVTMYE